MEFALFCLTAAIIAYFFERRSAFLTVINALFFLVLFVVYLFTSNLSFIQDGMINLIGYGEYSTARDVLYYPCIWLYSSYSAFFVVEVICAFLAFIGVTAHIVRKIYKAHKKRIELHSALALSYSPDCENIISERIYLKLCRLLN